MNRVKIAATAINYTGIETVLDVGCRSGVLREFIPDGVQYFGNDLVPGPNVAFVGNILDLEFEGKFDCIFALDVLEHVDMLHDLFDKLEALANVYLVVSLPNTYDLKSRFKYAINGRLGGKYEFSVTPSLDRHRWVMSHNEIGQFFRAKAKQFGLTLRLFDSMYGDVENLTLPGMSGIFCRALGRALATETVIGVFSKSRAQRAA